MTMKTSKKKLLEKKGYKVSDAQEFLGLTDEESAYIDWKIGNRYLRYPPRRGGLIQVISRLQIQPKLRRRT